MKYICENCGKPLENNNTVVDTKDDGTIHLFCRRCATLFGTCAMCTHTYCGFFNDPDPTPQFKVVAHTIQQGNATFVEQRQVPNADRIKRFCIDGGCKCFHDNGNSPICCRLGTGYATCPNYTETEQYKFLQNSSTQEVNEI